VQYTLQFPGQSLLLSMLYSELTPRKEMVWALYTDAQLLWHSCLHVRHNLSLTKVGKTDFAMRMWLETEAIKSMLNTHTCTIEQVFMYLRHKCIHPLLCLYTWGREILMATCADCTHLI